MTDYSFNITVTLSPEDWQKVAPVIAAKDEASSAGEMGVILAQIRNDVSETESGIEILNEHEINICGKFIPRAYSERIIAISNEFREAVRGYSIAPPVPDVIEVYLSVNPADYRVSIKHRNGEFFTTSAEKLMSFRAEQSALSFILKKYAKYRNSNFASNRASWKIKTLAGVTLTLS